MACDKFLIVKILELLLSMVCIIYNRITDFEALKIFYHLERYSREWPFLNNITWNEHGAIFADITFGGYVIICTGLLIGYATGELKAPKMESFFVILGGFLFIIAGSIIFAALEYVPHGLVDNAAVLGTIALLTGFLFLLDFVLSGSRRKRAKIKKGHRSIQTEVPIGDETNGSLTSINFEQEADETNDERETRQTVPKSHDEKHDDSVQEVKTLYAASVVTTRTQETVRNNISVKVNGINNHRTEEIEMKQHQAFSTQTPQTLGVSGQVQESNGHCRQQQSLEIPSRQPTTQLHRFMTSSPESYRKVSQDYERNRVTQTGNARLSDGLGHADGISGQHKGGNTNIVYPHEQRSTEQFQDSTRQFTKPTHTNQHSAWSARDISIPYPTGHGDLDKPRREEFTSNSMPENWYDTPPIKRANDLTAPDHFYDKLQPKTNFQNQHLDGIHIEGTNSEERSINPGTQMQYHKTIATDLPTLSTFPNEPSYGKPIMQQVSVNEGFLPDKLQKVKIVYVHNLPQNHQTSTSFPQTSAEATNRNVDSTKPSRTLTPLDPGYVLHTAQRWPNALPPEKRVRLGEVTEIQDWDSRSHSEGEISQLAYCHHCSNAMILTPFLEHIESSESSPTSVDSHNPNNRSTCCGSSPGQVNFHLACPRDARRCSEPTTPGRPGITAEALQRVMYQKQFCKPLRNQQN